MIELSQNPEPMQIQATTATQIQFLKDALVPILATEQHVDQQNVALLNAVDSLCDKIKRAVDVCRVNLIQDITDKSLNKTTQLHEQQKDIRTRIQTLEDYQNKVNALISLKDHARAIQATEELKKELKAIESAQLTLYPVTEATLRFVAVKELTAIGQIEDDGAIARYCTASGAGLSESFLGKEASFVIQAVNRNRTKCSAGGDRFDVADIGEPSIKFVLTDNNNGTYNVVYTPTKPSDMQISIRLRGLGIQGSPFTVPVNYADASRCTASGDGLIAAYKGCRSSFVIQAVDRFGVKYRVGGDRFDVATAPTMLCTHQPSQATCKSQSAFVGLAFKEVHSKYPSTTLMHRDAQRVALDLHMHLLAAWPLFSFGSWIVMETTGFLESISLVWT